MPWPGVTPVELRLEFARAYASGRYSMTELCDQYLISRKTGYKWVTRYEADGRTGWRIDRVGRTRVLARRIRPSSGACARRDGGIRPGARAN